MTSAQFRAHRAACGLTMAVVAKRLGVSLRTVWRWEHGVCQIDRFKAARIRQELVPGAWAKVRRSAD